MSKPVSLRLVRRAEPLPRGGEPRRYAIPRSCAMPQLSETARAAVAGLLAQAPPAPADARPKIVLVSPRANVGARVSRRASPRAV